MIIDATFWVAIAFIIFVIALIYLKIPQKVNTLLVNNIQSITNEIKEAEKLKEDSKNLLNANQEKLNNAPKEAEKLIKNAKDESEKLTIEMNNKFFQITENRKKSAEKKILQMKEDANKSIKNASIQIAIESVSKLITTSIDKLKLDALFKENLKQAKEILKKTRS